jgi:hypothetical protein
MAQGGGHQIEHPEGAEQATGDGVVDQTGVHKAHIHQRQADDGAHRNVDAMEISCQRHGPPVYKFLLKQYVMQSAEILINFLT